MADDSLVAGGGLAARIVSYIRQDESPHVEYLRTALSEMRDRTFVEVDGGSRSGAEVIDTLWTRALTESLGVRRENNRRLARAELDSALAGRSDRDEIIEEFTALASV